MATEATTGAHPPVAANPAALHRLAAAVDALGEEVLDWRLKALPPTAWGRTARQYLASGPRLADLPTPLLTLDAGRLGHNITAMAAWCADHGLELCPHGKTTMAPAIWLAQLRAGAWGITVANEFQLRVARAFGVPRVHVANTLLGPAGLAWLSGELAADPDWRVSCWVDSVEAVQIMSAALARGARLAPGRSGGDPALDVCVELGAPGGRTGARTIGDALEVAAAVRSHPRLRLVGVSGYEGAVGHSRGGADARAVDGYLDALAHLHRRLAPSYELAPGEDAIVTVGGSLWFDRVAARLSPVADPGGRLGPPTRVVLRSGAYAVHDDAHYRDGTPSVRGAGPELRAAIHGWARTVSRPEPGLAVLDAGRRDLPFDQDLPRPQVLHRAGGGDRQGAGTSAGRSLEQTRITALDDQHAYLHTGSQDGAPVDLRVGDVVRLGLSHPCTAFDKWTLVPVLDDVDAPDPKVVDLVRTYF